MRPRSWPKSATRGAADRCELHPRHRWSSSLSLVSLASVHPPWMCAIIGSEPRGGVQPRWRQEEAIGCTCKRRLWLPCTCCQPASKAAILLNATGGRAHDYIDLFRFRRDPEVANVLNSPLMSLHPSIFDNAYPVKGRWSLSRLTSGGRRTTTTFSPSPSGNRCPHTGQASDLNRYFNEHNNYSTTRNKEWWNILNQQKWNVNISAKVKSKFEFLRSKEFFLGGGTNSVLVFM